MNRAGKVKKPIQVFLSRQELRKLEKIRKALGIQKYSEVIRHLINEGYKQIASEKSENFVTPVTVQGDG
jgi:hypothetical protein